MIDSRFFTSNRFRAHSSSPLILSAHTAVQASNDVAASFQQESFFWYLTGIEAPDWWLVMEGTKAWLVAPEIDDTHRVFDGSLSFDRARAVSGIEHVITRKEGEELIATLSKKHSTVATLGKDPRASHYSFALNPAPIHMHRKLKKLFKEVHDCRLELTKLRAIKQPEELQAIRQAIEVTVAAFDKVKTHVDKYKYEYEIEADFSHHFRNSGAKGHAYEPIVAGGKNACTLHYINNQDRLNKKDLLLLDIGARVDGYAADITRTYALGKPPLRQQAVHAAVESAHKSIIALLKPGLSVIEYQERVDEIMKSKLKSLGLLKTPEDYRKYFPHAVSHGLGIDVHDALGRPETFEPGMVLTVEPGIYIPEEGIGVRIEDDILITKTGHENLSAALPTSL
jgi:Xaa-Pro aminopeptidase